MTGGDSFSDIYGDDRFIYGTNVKLFTEWLGVPLILGSQTYGPYSKRNIEKAKLAIKNSVLVMTRDDISAELVKNISGIDPIAVTDVAFILPYEKEQNQATSKIKN